MAGKQIPLTDELRAYLVAHSDPPRTDVHRDLMETTAREIGDLAIMQVAEEQGPWLSFMVGLLGATRVVEVGTFTGYSALCMAEWTWPSSMRTRKTTSRTTRSFSTAWNRVA